MTGWPVHVRGHRSLYYFLHDDEPNIFRYLRQNGYDVYWYGKNDLLVPESFASSVTEWKATVVAVLRLRRYMGRKTQDSIVPDGTWRRPA